MKTQKTAIILLIIALVTGGAMNTSVFASIGQGILHILGIGLSVDPEQQTAPINIETAVNTNIIFPDIDLGDGIPSVPQDLTIVAELTGPGLSEPKTISTRAGEQLMIPPLPQEGTYVLDNIRLMSGDQVLLYAEPSMALIDTIEKLLITQVTSRALDIDEIEDLGITISPDNFTAYEFTVGFVTESGRVEIKLPVVMDKLEKVSDFGITAPRKISKSLPSLKVPNLFIEGFKLGLYEEKDIEAEKEVPPIAGVVIIPGNIAFLNQFFEVMLLVTNNAPEGTPLVVTDLTAGISLPAGEDNIPDSIDDPLRIAQREEGTESVVPVINADDKGPDIAAQESGEGKFYIEGLKEGTHLVNIEITGTLLGLPSGPVEVKGTAIGTVLVRNPNFSLTFGHPDVVRAGEEYSLFVTVNNISQVDANLVYLSLPPGSVFGATVITDSDPESEKGTVEFRTIKAGDSAVAEFKMIARKTGRVTSTAFHGVEGVQGVFKLRTGVDERGIPLSSESLILSRYIDNLPEDLLYEAIRVLGLAHSVATSPMLPSGVTRISNNVLLQRAYELTEAGLRIEIGESVENSVDDLLMDWLGNGSPDKGFEEVLRNTDAGNDFLSEAGKIIGDTDHMSAQRSFGEVVKYRTPFISAVIDNTGQASAYIEITDSNDRSLGRGDDGSIVREIPYGVLVDLDGDPDIAQGDMALLDSRAGESYELKIKGINQGLINFGLILRDTDGGFVHAIYRDIAINAGETVTGQIISGADAPVLENGSSLIYPAEVYTYPANEGPKVIGAMQLAEADARNRGRVVAILFNEKIDPESANNPANYELLYRNLDKELRNPPKNVKILPGKRIIEVFFQCTISPFFEYDLILSGIKDPDMNTQDPDPARLPVVTTLTDPGGIVSGTVREGNGDPIPHTEVLMREGFTYQGITFMVITNRTITDKEGNYQIDYVAMNSGPSIESSDPQTGQTGSVSPRITMDRQHLKLDILLLGLGEVTGQVIRADDSSPVEYAIIESKSLNTRETFKTRSDQNGRFTLRSVPVGNLNVSAEKALYKGSIAVNIPSAGAVVDVTLPIYDTAISGSIKGRVFESDGITPVSGVPVMVKGDKYNNWQYSDEEGFYFFEDVADESVLLYTFRQETGEEAEAESAVSTGMTTTVNLVFPGTSTIVGTVTYSNGEPARARVLAGVNLVDTDENGNFIIDRVPIGSIKVKAADEYGDGDMVFVDIGRPGETVRVNIVIEKESIGTIQGYVKSADGQPLPYQRVIMKHKYGYEYALANSDGFFKKELPLRNYSVRIVNNSRTDGEEKKVDLALDGQTVTVDLQFKGFGTITGTIYQPDGVSPTVASVYISKMIYTDKGAPGKERVRYISDQLTDDGLTGKFVIENVQVGDFRLSASNDFYSKSAVALGRINNPGETVNVDIVLTSTSSVRGQVYLANGNKAGAGLPVTITPQKSAAKMQVLTGSDGTFEFDLVPSERFTLDVYDPLTGNRGIARGSVETGDEAVVDVHLFGQGTVNVKVINGGGDPVPDAKVNLNSGSDIAYLINRFPVILTDVNGEAVFYNVPEGEFSVTAKDPITLSGGKFGGTIPEDLTEVNVTIIVSASGSVEGIVYSPDGTETVPYAQVKIDMPGKPAFYATSDEEGKFIFTFVPLGKFDVDVFHPGTGRAGKSQGRINYDTQVVTVDVRLIAQGTVEGSVFTASGEIVPGAGIEISGEHLTGANVIVTTSNLDGMFMVSGIPEGSFTVKAIDDIKDISGEAYGEISYEGEVVRSDVYLEATGTIEGKVLAANTVTPAPYAEVSLKGDGYNGYTSSTVTDSEGNFSFTSIPLGIYELTALEQSGFDGGQSAAAIEYEGESRQVDIIFIGTGNIEGRVVMDDGTPPDMEAILTLKRTGLFNGEFTAYSDLDGNFTFYGIPTGEFSISAEIPGSYLGGAYTGTLDEDGMTLSVSIVIESAGEIHGLVFREDGSTLVKDALVTCSVVTPDNRRFEVYAASDENGEFRLSGVPLGDFTLYIRDFYSGGTGIVSGIITETDPDINFGTVVLDERPPGVVSITPVSGSIQVPPDSLITVTFSEPVDPGSINTNNIKVSDGSSSISGSLSLSDDRQTVTFTPDAEFSEFTPITVTVRFIRDDMWKYMQGMEVSTFTTADITPPHVLAARLINGAFVAEFSKPVVRGSGLFEVNFTGTGQPVEGNLTFSASDTVATLYPLDPLPDDTEFDLTISGYTDSFGNIQADEFSATYMTGDEIAPSITLTSSTPSAIEGTPVIVKAIPVDSPDLFIVDYRISGILVESVNREPFAMTIIPVETVTVTAIPTDYAGNMGEEVSITVEVIPNAPPASVILSPEDGYLAGTGKSVKIRAGASDDLGLKEIEMKVSSPAISMTRVYKISSDVLSDTHDFYFIVPSISEPGIEIHVEVISRDIRGLESLPAEIILITEDTTRPAVQITSFTKGFNVAPGDTIPVTVYASDNSAVSRIDFVTEGGLHISEYQDIEPPSYDAIAFFSLAIPADYSGGTKVTVAPFATDVNGNVGYAPGITLIVDDIIPPAVEIHTPSDGSSVMARDTVKISVGASDNDAIDRVEFFIDGQLFATDRYAYGDLYDATFKAPAEEGASVTLSARAYDKFENSAESTEITVNVVKDNIQPEVAILSYLPAIKFGEGHIVDIRISATDNIGISSAELLVNNNVVSTFENPASRYMTFKYLVEELIPVGSDSIIVPLEVRALDLDGNTGISGVYDIEIIRDNAPAVSIISPQPGRNVLGGATIHIEAEASDDFGIASIELRVNGATLATDTDASITADYNIPETALGSIINIEAVTVDTMGNSGSHNIDVNVPISVSQASVLSTGEEVVSSTIYNGYVYIFEKGIGVSVVDVSDVSSPNVIASLPIQGYYKGIDAYEGVIYVFGASGITLIDTADPYNPGILYSAATPGPVSDIAFRSGYAYAAMDSEGLFVLDVHDTGSPVSITYNIANVKDVDTEGDYLYISHGSSSPYLEIYSLADPVNPAALDAHNTGPVNSYDAEGDTGIAVTGNNKLSSFGYDEASGLRQFTDIVLKGSGSVNTVDLTGRYAIHASGAESWGMVEVAETGGLSDMGTILTGESIYKTILQGGHVYAADGFAGLRIYRIETLNTLSPEVSITSPVSGSSIQEGTEVEVLADVNNGDNALVTFYIDGKEVFTDEAAPYNYRFRVPKDITTIGIKARAQNLNGLTAESPEITLNIVEENEPPVITITTPPQDGTTPTLVEGNTLYVSGSAEDNYGIDRIYLLIDGSVVDSTLLPAFDLEYYIPDDGLEGTAYQIGVVVRAADVSGNISEAAFNVNVAEDNPPVITFITPQPNAEVFGGFYISLSVRAVDDSALEQVNFYEGDILLGAGTLTSGNIYTMPYRAPDVSVEETRSIKADAIDAAGQTSTAETSIIIKPSQTGVVTSVGNDAVTIDTEGNYAVTGGSNGVINVYNIGAPTSPVIAGSLDIGSEIKQVRIKGDKVYALNSSYMKIIDISDPVNPVQLSSTSVSTAYAVDVFDDIAFVGRNSAYIYVYDVRNAESPGYVKYQYLGGGTIQDITVDGAARLLYAVVDNASDSYLVVYDITDINNLAETGRVTIPGNARRMEIKDSKVYVANTLGMIIVDAADPADPSIIGSIDTPGDGTDIELLGNQAFIADGSTYGLSIVDITDPIAPLYVTSMETPGSGDEVSLANGMAFIADGLSGLTVVEPGDTPPVVRADLISITDLKIDGTVDVTGLPMAVTDEDMTVQVNITNLNTGAAVTSDVSAGSGFSINIDASMGDEIVLEAFDSYQSSGQVHIGYVPAGDIIAGGPVTGYARIVDELGNIAVTGDKDGVLSVFDISDPLDPLKLSSPDIGSEIKQVRIKGDKVYALNSSYMKIIDISDPVNPVQLSSTSVSTAYAMDVFEDIAFVGRYSYIYIYDVRNAESPGYVKYQYLGSGTIQDIKVDGAARLLYAVVDNVSDSYLVVYDITDINNLAETGRVTLPGNARRMKIIGDEAYFAVRSGMVIVSLSRLGSAEFGNDGDSDGTADDVLSYIETTGGATDVDIRGDYAYLADGMFNGIKMIDITDLAAPYEIADIHTPGDAIELKIRGEYAYIADGDAGLSIAQLYPAW